MIDVKNNQYVVQYLVAIIATLIMFSTSLSIGWSSPSLPILLGPDSPIPITSDEGSWIVSMGTFGSVFSVIPILFLSNRCGRKTFLLLISIPLLIGWTLIAITHSVAVLIVGRILIGFAYGCSLSWLPIYLAEISSKNIRGALTNFGMIMQQFSILYAFIIGPYVSITLMACISMIPVLIFLSLFIWCPESPYYLMKIGKSLEAERNLAKLRGNHKENVENELKEIRESLDKAEAKEKLENFSKVKEIFLPANRKRFALMIVLASLRHLTGSHSVLIYAETLFNSVGSTLAGSTASIIMGVIQLITCTISSSLVDRFGRRPILFTSLIAVISCDIILTIYYFIGRFYDDIQMASVFIVVVIIFCNASYTIGIAVIPPIVLGESFPQNLKPIAGAFYIITASMSGLTMLKLFQIVSDNVGYDCIFLIFSILSSLSLPYFWLCLPETKNQSLTQIQAKT